MSLEVGAMLMRNKLDMFKYFLENYWKSRDNEFFIDFVDQESRRDLIIKNNDSINSFLGYLQTEIDYYSISPYKNYYLEFLTQVKSILERRKNKQTEKQKENKENIVALTPEKQKENIDFLKSCYYQAVRDIVSGKHILTSVNNYEARIEVHKAISYIGKEIRELSKEGVKELIFMIKSLPQSLETPTILTRSIALNILIDCMFDGCFKEGIMKSSIKEAILEYDRISREDYVSLAIRISSLRDNPHFVEYSKGDVSVGSIVKINDGEERFWVKVTEIGLGKYFGVITNNLICNNGYDQGDTVVFGLEKIWDIENPNNLRCRILPTVKEENNLDTFRVTYITDHNRWPYLNLNIKESTKPDTFKPGDRVFFIKQITPSSNKWPYPINLYLGIVKGWSVSSSEKEIHCTFDSSFNVMNLETLDLNVSDASDVTELIKSDDFSKALIKSNTNSIYGNITLCPVDESLFPKLNKIINGLENKEC